MTHRILTAADAGARQDRPTSAVIDLLVRRNPLLAHGPRTHSTGIQLAAAPAAPRRPRARWDVDAGSVHLGHAGR